MVIVDDVLREAGFSETAIAEVKAGKLHYGGSLDAASDKELSVKLAFHVKAKLESAKEIFLDSPKKKEYDPTVESLGEFLSFSACLPVRMSRVVIAHCRDPYCLSPVMLFCFVATIGMIAVDGGLGSLEDFSGIKLTNEKVVGKLYRSAAPGSDLKLSKDEIPMFKDCKTHDEVENALRKVLLDRFRAYKRHGLDGIKPYARSKKEFSPGEEMRSQIEAGGVLPKRSPIFNRYTLEYPDNAPEGAEESFFWVNSVIDGLPTIALVHRMGMPQSGGYVYLERHFYISRSHNWLQGIGCALPVDDGAVVLYCTRTSTDQVSGIGSTAKRKIGNKIMGGRMAENFERAREVMAAAAAARDIEELKGG